MDLRLGQRRFPSKEWHGNLEKRLITMKCTLCPLDNVLILVGSTELCSCLACATSVVETTYHPWQPGRRAVLFRSIRGTSTAVGSKSREHWGSHRRMVVAVSTILLLIPSSRWTLPSRLRIEEIRQGLQVRRPAQPLRKRRALSLLAHEVIQRVFPDIRWTNFMKV